MIGFQMGHDDSDRTVELVDVAKRREHGVGLGMA
jgi:hypothetical protein